jgi:hypothetical protein
VETPIRPNGAAGMIKEIMAHLKEESLDVIFRMDSGYFDEDILETIKSLGYRYVIKGKGYPSFVAQVTDPNIVLITGRRPGNPNITTRNTWKKDRDLSSPGY